MAAQAPFVLCSYEMTHGHFSSPVMNFSGTRAQLNGGPIGKAAEAKECCGITCIFCYLHNVRSEANFSGILPQRSQVLGPWGDGSNHWVTAVAHSAHLFNFFT